MAGNTMDQQRMEAATTSVTAKLESFNAGLSPDERYMLVAALSEVRAGTSERAGDVAGYDYAINRAAKAYVDALPIWDRLQKAIAEMTRPIKW